MILKSKVAANRTLQRPLRHPRVLATIHSAVQSMHVRRDSTFDVTVVVAKFMDSFLIVAVVGKYSHRLLHVLSFLQQRPGSHLSIRRPQLTTTPAGNIDPANTRIGSLRYLFRD